MKVKVPREIKIAGHWYKIRYEKGLAQRHHKYGMVSMEDLAIYIEPNIPDSLKSQTLMHELTHCIGDNFISAEALSEDAVGQFATGTYVMLVDFGIEFDWSDINQLGGE